MTGSAVSSSSCSSSASPSVSTPPSSSPPSPTKRKQPNSIRLYPASDAADLASLVGKTLVGVRRSSTHPNVVLHFSDKSSFQIKVDGYNPQYPGIKKEIELSDRCAEIFPAKGGYSKVELTIDHCTCVSLLDKAFDRRGGRESSWEQSHLGIAFKFRQRDGWHCLWAMLAEWEEQDNNCVFRNFEDVYIACSAPQRHNRRRSVS